MQLITKLFDARYHYEMCLTFFASPLAWLRFASLIYLLEPMKYFDHLLSSQIFTEEAHRFYSVKWFKVIPGHLEGNKLARITVISDAMSVAQDSAIRSECCQQLISTPACPLVE